MSARRTGLAAPGRVTDRPEPAGVAVPRPAGEREGFLDTVRAIALLRVIAWHAFGAAAITYVIAAMPAMFFVTGSLLAKSLGRRPARVVLADRLRRILIPLWAFALVAWVAMAVAAAVTGTTLPWRRVVTWLVPFWDPEGTPWEHGWLSSHLWYLRALFWLFLASPVLLWLLRRTRGLVLVAAVAAVFLLDAQSRRRGITWFGTDVTWAVGDFALYGVFLMAGFAQRDGRFRSVTPRGWMAVAGVAAAGAVVWRLTQPVPLGVVNNSHPMHLFVGAAWLAAGLAAQRFLGGLARARWTGGFIRAMGRRALTIYLWHTTAVIVALNVLDERGVDDPVARNVGLVLLTALGVLAAVWLFGWIEDVAARRPPALSPSPAARSDASSAPRARWLVPAGLLATTAALLVLAPGVERDGREGTTGAAAARRPPTPSQQPPAPVFEEQPTATVVLDLNPAEQSVLARGLDAVLAEWAAEYEIGGAVAAVAVGPDLIWRGATGNRPDDGPPVTVNDRIDLASITKLFTAVLVHRFADSGLIDLTGPLPQLQSLPHFPYDQGITVEQLLEHSSGLVNYAETTQYLRDPEIVADPVAAVTASLEDGLLAGPGEVFAYSSTNYLVLGLLLEEVSGRSYDELLAEGMFKPLGLAETLHRPSGPGDPRGATAGIETTARDLVSAGVAILRDHGGLSDESYESLTGLDPSTRAGKGTFGYCPCRIDEDGSRRFFAIGHWGATAVLAYVPSLDLTLAVDLTESLWEGGRFEAVPGLLEKIEHLALYG